MVAGVGAGQFTSGVNLVEVYASVTDGQGTPVTGLKQADFELRENGELQAIANFTAGDFPLSVAVAMDRIGLISMVLFPAGKHNQLLPHQGIDVFSWIGVSARIVFL